MIEKDKKRERKKCVLECIAADIDQKSQGLGI